MQPVVKLVGKPVECLYTRYSRLLNLLSNRLDNRLYRVYKRPTGCHTGLTTQPVGCFYTMQPVVQPV